MKEASINVCSHVTCTCSFARCILKTQLLCLSSYSTYSLALVRHLSFKVISDMHGFRVYRGSRKGGWEKNIPYQEELSGILCGRELETGSASGCFSVKNFIYIVLNDQAVYVVTKLPL